MIVGAGLVGATLALRLSSSGLRIGLLDKSTLSVTLPRDNTAASDQPALDEIDKVCARSGSHFNTRQHEDTGTTLYSPMPTFTKLWGRLHYPP